MHRYRIYDLTLEAEFPLPELVADESGKAAPADISIRVGGQGSRPDVDSQKAGATQAEGSWVAWQKPLSMLTHFVEAGRYLVREGREVVVYPHADADPDRVRHMLLGPVLAQLLWQRGVFALHGCVLQIGEVRAAFLGVSGEGKSTLAMALLQAGHTLYCDDVAALDWSAQPVLVRPSFPRLRAYADTFAQLGLSHAGLAQAHRELAKWLLPAQRFATTPKPLDRIYILASGDALGAELLGRGQAMMEILRHTYYAEQFAGLYGVSRHMGQAGKLAEVIPTYRLVRPKQWSRVPELVRFVEEHLRV